ncbi:MAG: hypothetical protein NUV61_01910 [Candidatus Azambacteria bacterium]|nr:hypothetical protein [Candidatus Azambacteria bacterium]
MKRIFLVLFLLGSMGATDALATIKHAPSQKITPSKNVSSRFSSPEERESRAKWIYMHAIAHLQKKLREEKLDAGEQAILITILEHPEHTQAVVDVEKGIIMFEGTYIDLTSGILRRFGYRCTITD